MFGNGVVTGTPKIFINDQMRAQRTRSIERRRGYAVSAEEAGLAPPNCAAVLFAEGVLHWLVGGVWGFGVSVRLRINELRQEYKTDWPWMLVDSVSPFQRRGGIPLSNSNHDGVHEEDEAMFGRR